MEAESNKDKIGLRIKELIYELRLDKKTFGLSIGSNGATIGNIVNEESKPGFSILSAILEKYPLVSEKWLMRGDGPMFINSEGDAPEKPKARPDAYLMEQLQALEKSWKENIADKERTLHETQQMVVQQKFIIETLMSQLNTALGKVDLSKETLRVSKLIIVKRPTKIIQFARTLANSGTK